MKRDNSKNISKWIGNSLKNSLDILLITGAGGALGYIIRTSGVIESLGIVNFNGIYGLVSVFLIAALIKTVQGSSTVAIITTCALASPLIDQVGVIGEIEKVLLITSIGSGAMTVSHVNDSYFWVVTKYSNLENGQKSVDVCSRSTRCSIFHSSCLRRQGSVSVLDRLVHHAGTFCALSEFLPHEYISSGQTHEILSSLVLDCNGFRSSAHGFPYYA